MTVDGLREALLRISDEGYGRCEVFLEDGTEPVIDVKVCRSLPSVAELYLK